MTTSPTAERISPNASFGTPHVFILALVNGEEPQRVHRIAKAETLVGRGEDADFMLDDDEVSARHAMIRVDGPVCILTELGSCNGTLVNGRPVREGVGQRLRHLDEIQVGLVDDGTAIGLGLATAVARLKHSTSPSRTVILLTDGVNNVPTLEPETAARLAKSLDVRVYTVAIGRQGMVPYPVNDPIFGRQTRQVETQIDLDLLRSIAGLTGGEMFQATDPQTLVKIFETIDALETARYETTVSTWYRERMAWFAVPALLLLLFEAVLGATWLRRLP